MTDVAVDLPTRIMHRTVEEILNPGQRLAANPAKGHRVNIARNSAPKAPFSFRSHCGPRPAATMCFSGNGLHVPTEWPEERYRWSFREPPPAMTNPHALRTFKHLVWELSISFLSIPSNRCFRSVIWVIRWFPRTKSTSTDPSPKWIRIGFGIS